MEKKTIIRQILSKILKGFLMPFAIAIFLGVVIYQSEIPGYGLGKFELVVLPLALVLIVTLISFLCHLRIQNYRTAYRLSAVLSPIPYGIYSYFACSGDYRCLKWLPLGWFFMLLITELILLPITYTIRSSFEILRGASKRALPEFTNQEVYLVGKRQKMSIWLLLALTIAWIIGYVGALLFSNNEFLVNLLSMIVMSIGFISMLFSYRLAKAQKKGHPGLWIFAMLIPLINLICLLLLILSASKILHSKNIHIGIMGASREDLEKLLLPQSEASI